MVEEYGDVSRHIYLQEEMVKLAENGKGADTRNSDVQRRPIPFTTCKIIHCVLKCAEMLFISFLLFIFYFLFIYLFIFFAKQYSI